METKEDLLGQARPPQELPWEEMAKKYNEEYCRFKNEKASELGRYYYRDDKWD